MRHLFPALHKYNANVKCVFIFVFFMHLICATTNTENVRMLSGVT